MLIVQSGLNDMGKYCWSHTWGSLAKTEQFDVPDGKIEDKFRSYVCWFGCANVHQQELFN